MQKRIAIWAWFGGAGCALAGREILSWGIGHALDYLWIESGGVDGAGVVMTSLRSVLFDAGQDVLLGIFIGLGIALLTLYWSFLRLKVRRAIKWTALFLRATWLSHPGYRRLVWGGGIKLLPGIESKIFDTVPFDITTARFENKTNEAVRLEVLRPGVIRASRIAGDNEEPAIVKYELWGRPLFWPGIKKAWKTDRIGLREWVRSKEIERDLK